MGRAYASIDGDLTSAFFNPAGIATIKGIEVDGSFATPYYSIEQARYTFASVGYRINKNMAVALSTNHFSWDRDPIAFVDGAGNVIGVWAPKNENYALTFAAQPIKNLMVGLKVNHFRWTPNGSTSSSTFADFGVIKKFELAEKEASMHTASLGASVSNFTTGKLEGGWAIASLELPMIARIGANYQLTLGKNSSGKLETLQLLLQGEYQGVINSVYETAVRFGGEITVKELISIRAGHYSELQDDFGYPINVTSLSSFTYGLGVQIPLYKLTGTPVNINIDYTLLPQPSHSLFAEDYGNFTTLNLRVTWLLDGKDWP
jgi:hypothetical protein